MAAKNYICTAKGFVKNATFSGMIGDLGEKGCVEVNYTDKVREAGLFSTKSAGEFLDRHNIAGFIWKPYEQEPIRDMYTVQKVRSYGFMYNEDEDEKQSEVNEWKPVRMHMVHDSDVSFLTSKRLKADDAMTFEDAKAEAIKLNTEMLSELMEKMTELQKLEENK